MSHQNWLKQNEEHERKTKERICDALGEKLDKFKWTKYEDLTDKDKAEIAGALEQASSLAYETVGHFDIRSSAAWNFFFWAKDWFNWKNDRRSSDSYSDWRTLRHIALLHADRFVEGCHHGQSVGNLIAGEWLEKLGYWADAIHYYRHCKDRDRREASGHILRLATIMEECGGEWNIAGLIGECTRKLNPPPEPPRVSTENMAANNFLAKRPHLKLLRRWEETCVFSSGVYLTVQVTTDGIKHEIMVVFTLMQSWERPHRPCVVSGDPKLLDPPALNADNKS